MVAATFDPGSFRDRTGRIVHYDGQIYRVLNDAALAQWEYISATRFFRRFCDAGRVVETVRVLPQEEPPVVDRRDWAAVLRHARIPYVSYPYEWCFDMLRDAALLQIDLLLAALDEGAILKDATPYNVQWVGSEPVFIDVASFERLAPGAPWIGYRQFCELYLYPLLLQAYKNVSFQPWLRGRLEGIPAAEMRALLSWRDFLRAGILTHVVLQASAQARLGKQSGRLRGELKRAGFHQGLIVANVRRLRRLVEQLTWDPGASIWSEYASTHSYTQPGMDAKKAFVRDAAAERFRELVWDIGANTGVFSRLVAPHARTVVAMDGDHATINRLYAELRREGQRTILPLVVNLADPSPGLGWLGSERRPLGERGRPELVLCLALIHHLVIGSHVPLASVVSWLLDVGDELIVEFAARDDAMVQLLLGNKGERYEDYDQAKFEQLLAADGTIVRSAPVPGGTRTLYQVRSRRRGT